MFGTDTWADCLVALFFKDAFHSLHRYLYFMENEEPDTGFYSMVQVTVITSIVNCTQYIQNIWNFLYPKLGACPQKIVTEGWF